MTCGYCTQRATSQIPSIPADVCLTHAIEYWTGLLACARDQPVCEQAPGADASERAADDAPKAGIRRRVHCEPQRLIDAALRQELGRLLVGDALRGIVGAVVVRVTRAHERCRSECAPRPQSLLNERDDPSRWRDGCPFTRLMASASRRAGSL